MALFLGTINIAMVRGKTGAFYLSAFQNDGVTPQSLVGSTLGFHAHVGGIDLDYSSPSDGIAILDSAGGEDCAFLTIPPADTEGIPEEFGAHFKGECELVLVNGANIFPLDNGYLTVESNVGTP